MAEDEAEQAFFHGQAMNAEAEQHMTPSGADNDDSDDYDPSNTVQDLNQTSFWDHQRSEDVPAVTNSPDPNSPSPGSFASNMDAGQQASDVHPSQTPTRAESETSTPVPPPGASAPPKTRTIGGFVVEDDDEEDKGEAEYEPPAVLEVEDTNAMPVTMSEEASSGNAIQNTSTAQGSASAQDVANSSYSSIPVSNIDVSSVPGHVQWAPQDSLQNSTVPTPVSDSPFASRARLPHDRVGILQDRVDEDPRGDIPAWLELIAENRTRNRLDSAREAYERFLKVFPMAVS